MSYGVFNKRQLIDQCGFSADEAIIILEYQKKIPIIVENDGVDGFCIDARDLWEQLGQPHGDFANWVNRRFRISGFEENVDFKVFPQFCGKGRPRKEYMITVDMAKHLSMLDKSDIGYLTRKYFLLMEKAVKQVSRWTLIREPLRKAYIVMDEALNQYYQRNDMRDADKYDYQYEANMLNIIATGFIASELRSYLKCKDNITRDSLTATYNEYLMKLQEWDTAYIRMNMNRAQRFQMLQQMFNATFPNAVPIKSDAEITKINQNKEDFYNKLTA